MNRDSCEHLKLAKLAQERKTFADEATVDLNTLLSHVKDMSLEQILINEASDNQIVVYKLPGGNLAVPLLGLAKDQYMTDFVHLRDNKCSIEEKF